MISLNWFGDLGYTVRTAISSKETFEVSDMFIEAGSNTANGLISFVGGMLGAVTGVYLPGEKNGIKNFFNHHINMLADGYYPAKFLISFLKNDLKEDY